MIVKEIPETHSHLSTMFDNLSLLKLVMSRRNYAYSGCGQFFDRKTDADLHNDNSNQETAKYNKFLATINDVSISSNQNKNTKTLTLKDPWQKKIMVKKKMIEKGSLGLSSFNKNVFF